MILPVEKRADNEEDTMRKHLLISAAAAALIGTTGLASAQAPGGGTSGAPSAPAAQSAPSGGPGAAGERAAPMDRSGVSDMKAAPGTKGGQAEQRMPADKAAPQRAQSGTHDDMKAKGAASESRDRNAADSRDRSSDQSRDRNAAESRDRNGAGKAASDSNADRNGMKGAEKNAPNGKAGATTGQAGAGAKLSAEQRTTVRTAITKQNVKPVTNINFSISVGTRVPRTVEFHPLPTELVTIYPSWRGYEFFLVGDEIVVVNPRTLEIVAVLEA